MWTVQKGSKVYAWQPRLASASLTLGLSTFVFTRLHICDHFSSVLLLAPGIKAQ